MDATYNGWTNYETWVAKLWIDNEKGSYYYWRERAQKYAESGEEFMENAYNLSQELKDTAEEEYPVLNGVWADLLGSAFQSINWYEIAESLLNE